VQLPPEQFEYMHVAPLGQVIVHPPPEHATVHVDPDAHDVKQ
jgi:hypothetical protein